MATATQIPTYSEINRHFVIRYRETGDKRFSLIGGGKYHILVGTELRDKHFLAAFTSGKSKHIIKLRRGLEIHFAAK